MSNTATMDMPAALLAAWRVLPEPRRASVVDFASFLAREEERLIEESEAEWDKRFNDPAKMAKFQQWAEGAIGNDKAQPLDLKRL